MTNISKIVLAIMKARYAEFFVDDEYSHQECIFREEYQRTLQENHLWMEVTKDGKRVLIWSSAINLTLACSIADNTIVFSAPYCYDKESRGFTVPVSDRFGPESPNGKIITKEINKIKHLIAVAFPEFATNFR